MVKNKKEYINPHVNPEQKETIPFRRNIREKADFQ